MAEPIRVEPKSLLKSKTFYFGLLTIVIAIANFFGFSDFQPSDPVIGITGAIIIILRFVTKSPIQGIK